MSQLPLSLKLLRSFVTVAEELHFGRAARKLGLSQPPLSQHIALLESELETRLFDRTRRNVALTSAGRLLYEEARSLLAHAEQVRQSMESRRSGMPARLTLGCVPSALFGVLPPIIRRFRNAYPHIELVLSEAHTATIMDQIIEGALDVGLVWENKPPEPLEAQVVWRDVFVAAVPAEHPLAVKSSLSLDDLVREALILSPRQITPRYFDTVIGALGATGVTPRITRESNTVLSQIGFVANGLGIALVPPFVARLPIPGIIYLPVAGLRSVDLGLVWNSHRTHPEVAALSSTFRLFGEVRD